MMEFPASVFVQFFRNHGLLSMCGQPQWRTVDCGSEQYVSRIVKALGDCIRTGCAVKSDNRAQGEESVRYAAGQVHTLVLVVLVCHSDEALSVLAAGPSTGVAARIAVRSQQ